MAIPGQNPSFVVKNPTLCSTPDFLSLLHMLLDQPFLFNILYFLCIALSHLSPFISVSCHRNQITQPRSITVSRLSLFLYQDGERRNRIAVIQPKLYLRFV